MAIHNPLHPGEIIKEILIEGAGLSVTEAADKLGVNRTTLSRLINGHMGISPDMALRLSKLLPNSDIALWLNLQRDYDIWQILKSNRKINIKPLGAAA
jgi:addiction module HigA family antidote